MHENKIDGTKSTLTKNDNNNDNKKIRMIDAPILACCCMNENRTLPQQIATKRKIFFFFAIQMHLFLVLNSCCMLHTNAFVFFMPYFCAHSTLHRHFYSRALICMRKINIYQQWNVVRFFFLLWSFELFYDTLSF